MSTSIHKTAKNPRFTFTNNRKPPPSFPSSSFIHQPTYKNIISVRPLNMHDRDCTCNRENSNSNPLMSRTGNPTNEHGPNVVNVVTKTMGHPEAVIVIHHDEDEKKAGSQQQPRLLFVKNTETRSKTTLIERKQRRCGSAIDRIACSLLPFRNKTNNRYSCSSHCYDNPYKWLFVSSSCCECFTPLHKGRFSASHKHIDIRTKAAPDQFFTMMRTRLKQKGSLHH